MGSLYFGTYSGVDAKNIFKQKFKSGFKHNILSPLCDELQFFLIKDPFKRDVRNLIFN